MDDPTLPITLTMELLATTAEQAASESIVSWIDAEECQPWLPGEVDSLLGEMPAIVQEGK
jgi:hypothetical protein